MYRGTQPLKTIIFHVLFVLVLYELCVTVGQHVCVQLLSASSLPADREGMVSRWQTVTEQSETDMAESGMSAPANHPRLVNKADAQSEIWKYFSNVADSKGKPTVTTKPVCKQCFKSVMDKGANTSNPAKHLADRHANLFKEFKELQVSDR